MDQYDAIVEWLEIRTERVVEEAKAVLEKNEEQLDSEEGLYTEE